jgi:hypothetical protein
MTGKQTEGKSGDPTAGHPSMPGYGLDDAAGDESLLPWSWAHERLTSARNYALCTTRPDGRPHVMPVWGVWLDGAFYFSTGPQSRKALNLASNPACVVYPAQPDTGVDALVVEGDAEVDTDPERRRRVFELYGSKYAYDMSTVMDPLHCVRPKVVFGFTDGFPGSATRWVFDKAPSSE